VEHYYSLNRYLKETFGGKVYKLALDGGFTCPNRDGSKGTVGCIFCSDSGSGDFSVPVGNDMDAALEKARLVLSHKHTESRYIAYFQNHTNTYAPAEHLRDLFTAALGQPVVSGLAIATRSDCISDEVLDLLEELDRQTFLWVELGLQTIHDETARAMNLCHTLADYDYAVARLHSRGIRTVTHLIAGLPGESRRMMLESVKHVCQPLHDHSSHLFGLKLHMLNVVRSSALPLEYPGYVPFESIDDYTDFVVEALELVPPDITIHRISGDAPRRDLIAPEWSWQKRTILNEIHRKMRERNTWQGRRSSF